MERRLVALMFTDVVDSSRVMGASEQTGIRVRQRHFERVREQVRLYGGESIDATGDETLSWFASAVAAVNCALSLTARLEDDPELKVRIGLHIGDVVFEGERVHGEGVNVGARILSLARPGGIAASGEVFDAVHNQPNIEGSALGERELKGIDHRVRVYEISGTPAPLDETPVLRAPPVARATRAGRLRAAGIAVVLLGAAWLAVWAFLRPGPELEIRSLAVLPLANLSGDPDQGYFADGMTDALIGELARIDTLRVLSRTSAMQQRDREKTLPELAEELDIDAVIEGSVLRSGNRVRISVQLVDAREDRNLWSQTYEREISDILKLQGEVADAIIAEIARELQAQRTRFVRPMGVNAVAYDSTLKGRHYMLSLTPEDHALSVRYFELAIAADPEYAPAYAGLADAYT